MYIPSIFAETDLDPLYSFIDEHSFATLVTVEERVPFASHLPMLLDRQRGVLLGHLARANPHWRSFATSEALVIFAGPHGYISPTWYEVTPAVPTWNFTVVHVYGQARAILEECELSDIVDRLLCKYEKDPTWLKELPADYRHKMLQGIVGVEVPVERIEGKYKLSQNRSHADRLEVVRQLEQRDDAEAHRLAAMMRTKMEAR
jgi:transcriptional regulator